MASSGTSAQEIRERLSQYLRDETSLEEFEDWFIPAAWNLNTGIDDATSISNELFLLIAEHDNGDWSEDNLRELLTALLTETSTEAARERINARYTARSTPSSRIADR